MTVLRLTFLPYVYHLSVVFGQSVSMTDNYAIVGASGAKKSFIFAINNGVWNTTAVATIDGYTSETQFGKALVGG